MVENAAVVEQKEKKEHPWATDAQAKRIVRDHSRRKK